MKQLKQILLSYLEEWGLIKNLQKRSDVPKRRHLCKLVKHLLHIGEKRREELIGGLPAQGAHREVVVLVHVSP